MVTDASDARPEQDPIVDLTVLEEPADTQSVAVELDLDAATYGATLRLSVIENRLLELEINRNTTAEAKQERDELNRERNALIGQLLELQSMKSDVPLNR